MTFQIVKGDLFDPGNDFSVIAQGVNCRGVMGAGIAVPFRQTYPLMFEEYKKICAAHHAVLPGTIQFSSADSMEEFRRTGTSTIADVVNLFTQYNPGKNNADYAYLEKSLYNLDSFLVTFLSNTAAITGLKVETVLDKVRVGLPLIGCGIGGLDRHNVVPLMEHYLASSVIPYTLVER